MIPKNISTLWNLRSPRADRDFKPVIYRCDICDEHLTEVPDNLEAQIDMLQEIDDSYECEYDKHEPRLLLCNYCQKEYSIPSWIK